jgi:hypothetical protein
MRIFTSWLFKKSGRNVLMKPSRIASLTTLKKMAYKNWGGVTGITKLTLFEWEDVETSEDCATDPLSLLVMRAVEPQDNINLSYVFPSSV